MTMSTTDQPEKLGRHRYKPPTLFGVLYQPGVRESEFSFQTLLFRCELAKRWGEEPHWRVDGQCQP